MRRLAEWIEGREEVHIRGPGTDLRLGVAGRRFIAADGQRNMPDGEFFTGPVEDSAQGEITFTYPLPSGGARWPASTCASGTARSWRLPPSAVRICCTRCSTATPARGAWGNWASAPTSRSLAALARSCSTRRSGGTIHLALGRSYPETGGVNESALHWDLICDLRRAGTVTVDGEELQRDGAFRV